ncbi:unnamed protein product, partial [Heterotrigona itama]
IVIYISNLLHGTSTSKMLENINKELLPIKTHYFLFNAATGPIVPFLPTIAKQLGFSAFLTGTIYTILPISGLIAKPLFGALADKFKIYKMIFLMFQAVVAIAMFSIYFIPEIESSAIVQLNCNGDASIEICSKNRLSNKIVNNVITETVHLNVSCQINNCMYIHSFNVKFSDNIPYKPTCENYVNTSCLITCYDNAIFNQLLHDVNIAQNSAENKTYQFYLFLLATIISWIGMAVVVSIADAICFNFLGNERRNEYGKQKMWGSIGFGIFGISAGYLVDLFSEGKLQKDYSCIFYIMLVIMVLDIIVSATLKKKNPDYSEDEPSILWELLTILKEGNVLAFGWWCIGAGMCTSVVWNFLFWYTEDLASNSQITWLKTLQGLMTGVQCFLGELPFNFISGTVLQKLGHVNVMSLVLLIYAIRFMAYSIVSNLWWFLVIEILHGPTLGLCWPTMVSYGDKVTPPGTKATIQGFIGAIFEGIGVSSGSLICGWLINKYGSVVALRAFSVGALLWLSCFWLIQLFLRKFKTSSIHMGHN